MAESKAAVYGAITANVAIAATKFTVAAITGSSAMLSEAIHSLVDSGNGVLLLVGVKRSGQAPTREHPFGFGKELYFWGLIVGVLIFGLGGGISFYEGLLHVRDPSPIEDPMWNYIVLGVAAVFESISFTVAWRQFSAQRGKLPIWRALHTSKDPTVYTVLAEDSAALAGLAVAALGIYASHRLDMPELDGVASMLIGLLLAGVAVLLIRESRGLLVGEGVRADTARQIRELAGAQPGVRQVGPVLSMYIGAEEVLVTLEITFAEHTPAKEVAATIERIEHEVRDRFPVIKRVYIEPVASASAAAA